MKGVTKYSPGDIKRNKGSSFLHKWKRISNPKLLRLHDDVNKKNFQRSVSLSPDYDKKYVPFREEVDIKIACRDFIFAERYYSLLQSDNLRIMKNMEMEYNRKGYDTSFLLPSADTKKKQPVKSVLSPKSSTKSSKKRPFSMNVQVRFYFLLLFVCN